MHYSLIHPFTFLGCWARSGKEADPAPLSEDHSGERVLGQESHQSRVQGRAGSDVCLAGVF